MFLSWATLSSAATSVMGPRLKASRRRHHHASSRNRGNKAVTNHDDSGQVYTEVTCAATSTTTDWKWKTRGSIREYCDYVSQSSGCSSLYDTAIRCCLSNSVDITAETLEEVPEAVGGALWDRLTTASVIFRAQICSQYSACTNRSM